mgnify:CR=1 FL=1
MTVSPAVRHWLLWVAGGIAAAWIVGVFWWWLLEPAGKEDLKEIVIPRGTAAAIAAGQPAPGIPSTYDLGRAREVRIVNNDTAEHYIGGTLIRAGADVTIEPEEREGTVTCSFHSAGAITFTLSERPSIFVTLIPAILLGLPFGLAFGGAVFVAQRLRTHDEAEAPAS